MYYNGKDRYYNKVFTIGKWYAVFGGDIKYCISDDGDNIYLHGGLDMYLQNTPLTNSEIENATLLQLVKQAKDDIANNRTMSSETFKQRLSDKKATLLEKETIMQNERKQQFPAITVTETIDEVVLKTEYATWEDYEKVNKTPTEVFITIETSEDIVAIKTSLEEQPCNCDGCTCGDEEEEILVNFTLDELLTINQILGFVGSSQLADNIIDKITPYIDPECLDEAFTDVYVQQVDVTEGSHRLPFKGVKLQDNGYILKID